MHRIALLLAVSALATGCAAAKASMPSLQPLAFDSAPAAKAPLEQNFFSRDRNSIGEAELKTILEAPVYLEEGARVGVVPVATRYEPDEALPIEPAPQVMVDTLESSGMFELASEVSTEWPADRGLPGLRELAARYRTEYLLLYRHRFNDAVKANAGAIGYVTLVGALFIPGTSIDTAGVLEATLYDVKSGTILFTILERVRAGDAVAPPAVASTLDALHRKLVGEASKKLADQVVQRCRRLEAARPAKAPEGAVTVAPQG